MTWISKDGNSKPLSALLASEVERLWADFIGRNDPGRQAYYLSKLQ